MRSVRSERRAAWIRSQRPPDAATAVATRQSYDGPEYPSSVSVWDFVIIVAVIALVFGTRPFVRALRSLKSGGRELKRGLRGDDELPPPKG
jgi:hypothetical protein